MRYSVREGDVTASGADVIVNAWNRNVIPWFLLLMGGVSRAIRRKAGFAPFNELLRKGPIPVGGAVVTSPGKLPAKAIVHVAGIDLLWRASPRSVAESTANAVRLARDLGAKTIAFPVIGGGSLGMTVPRALETMEIVLAAIPHEDIEATIFRWR